MNASKHMLIVVGARPQFIKAAALHRALSDGGGWRSTWLHTGQHHDEALSGQFFQELGLPEPDVRLTPNPMSRELRLGDMMEGIRSAIDVHCPSWVVVFGDTDSTLAGAWAATAKQVPLIHIEAGLRSHDWHMPEEVNRVLTDRMSSVLVCPTHAAVDHLTREAVLDNSAHGEMPSVLKPWVLKTGDIMHDNAVHFNTQFDASKARSGSVLMTMHRPSNVDDPEVLWSWIEAIGAWLKTRDLRAVWPIHPRTQKGLQSSSQAWQARLARNGVEAVEPMGYVDLLEALHRAPLVLTDSGGVQKEAYSLGRRCVVLRDTTEWTEQVSEGQSVLCPTPATLELLADGLLEQGPFSPGLLYGAGQAARELMAKLNLMLDRVDG
jgi:UDP-GlcNAc3NAcA epimerase